PPFLRDEAPQTVDRQGGDRDGADGPGDELPPTQAESFRMLGRDIDEQIVEEGRVQPVPDELAEHREADAHRGVRPKEARIQDREDRKEDDSRGAERVKGHDEPALLEPSLDAAIQDGVDSREDQEDGEGREEREELRALSKGPNEERFDRAGDAADDEVHRDLREEYAEAKGPHEKRDEEAHAACDDSGGEPVPGKPSNECPEILTSLGHARATPGRSLEPMPPCCAHDQSFI